MRAITFRARIAGISAALAALSALSPLSVQAAPFSESGDQDLVAQRYARLLATDEAAIAEARADAAALSRQTPDQNWLNRYSYRSAVVSADYRYRSAIRLEQRHLFDIAVKPGLETAVFAYIPADLNPQVGDSIDAFHAMWRLAGYDELNLLHIRTRPLAGALPASDLASYYVDAAGRYQLDWSYLASINYIESDFGRVPGTSSAGALGPMQFMPATWSDYGAGGDINNPRDAIQAAARYLFVNGGRKDINRAVFAYNHDWDYVQAVADYASVIRRDPTWLDRLYYWSTAG